MKKRKLVLLALAVSMVAILAVGGTLAYFTDTETAKNVFTVGKIDIALNETNGDWLEVDDPDSFHEDDDYRDWLLEPEQELVPDLTLPKYVKVENTGSRDAFMWIEIWIPAALDDSTTKNHAGSSLHLIYDDSFTVQTKVGYLGQKQIGTQWYNGYIHFNGDNSYVGAGKDAEGNYWNTDHLLQGVKMDIGVKQCTNSLHTGCHVLSSDEHYTGSWELVINAIGIQADTIYDDTLSNVENVCKAINLYYGGTKDVADYLW